MHWFNYYVKNVSMTLKQICSGGIVKKTEEKFYLKQVFDKAYTIVQ